MTCLEKDYDIVVALDGEARRRLDKLTTQLNTSKSNVVAAALKVYEDMFEAVKAEGFKVGGDNL